VTTPATEHEHDRPSLLRIGSATPPQSAASSIFRCVTESHIFPEIRAIGHGAIGQAVKAMAIARGHLAPKGIDLAFIPGFETIEDAEGKEISAIVFRTFQR
jgi:stage V sporulation protein S